MNLKVIIFVVIVLMVLNVYLLFQLQNTRMSAQFIIEKYDKTLNEEKRSSWLMFRNMLFQYQDEAIQLADFKLTPYDSCDSFAVSSLVNNGTKLFFRFKETDCTMCINKFMEVLKNIPDNFPMERLVILCGYENFHEYRVFVTKNNMKMKVFNIDKLPGLITEEINEPYFFVLNKELKIQNIYIPDKNNTENLNRYFLCLISKYWP